jgi:hypothetical protein
MIKKEIIVILFFILIINNLMSVVFASTIIATGKPGTDPNLPYVWSTHTYEDYCPLCGAYGSLLLNPKGVPERELTCSACDADYDIPTGMDKDHKRRDSLIPAIKSEDTITNQVNDNEVVTKIFNSDKNNDIINYIETINKFDNEQSFELLNDFSKNKKYEYRTIAVKNLKKHIIIVNKVTTNLKENFMKLYIF